MKMTPILHNNIHNDYLDNDGYGFYCSMENNLTIPTYAHLVYLENEKDTKQIIHGEVLDFYEKSKEKEKLYKQRKLYHTVTNLTMFSILITTSIYIIMAIR